MRQAELVEFTCIVDQDVEFLLSLEEVLAELANRRQAGQIQLHVKNIKTVTLKLDLPDSFLSLFHISASNDDTCASHCQGNSRVLANTRIPTCKTDNKLVFNIRENTSGNSFSCHTLRLNTMQYY